MKREPTTVLPSHYEGPRAGDWLPTWAAWDAAAWRLMAFDLLDLDLHHGYVEFRCKSTEQYADWELGLLPGYCAELLRIARKLLDLPEVDRALVAGELTWEQVVVLTRVAVPKHELAWVDRAVECPLEELTDQVERSAEGWAPPVAWDGGSEARGVASGASAEAARAMSRSRRAPNGGRRLHGGSRHGQRIEAGRARKASAPGSWRRPRAPNVRQAMHALPLTQ
jgi:hypothetical protein